MNKLNPSAKVRNSRKKAKKNHKNDRRSMSDGVRWSIYDLLKSFDLLVVLFNAVSDSWDVVWGEV